ncbi:MAG: hypothetical protein KatS3mg005_0926 [Bryobacteraceae bacterium]|nr:MAG: hypothetical protein KatS3mg005_0926 [Bryobacteraceae bacterium]
MAQQDSSGLVSRRTAVIGASILVAFLLGFLIQFGAARQAESSRAAAESEAARLRQQLTLAELRDLAALLLFEVTQRNFGTASQHSTALFDRLQSLAVAGSADPRLSEALAARDRVTAGLAAADPAVQAEVQRVFHLVFQATRSR